MTEKMHKLLYAVHWQDRLDPTSEGVLYRGNCSLCLWDYDPIQELVDEGYQHRQILTLLVYKLADTFNMEPDEQECGCGGDTHCSNCGEAY